MSGCRPCVWAGLGASFQGRQGLLLLQLVPLPQQMSEAQQGSLSVV